MQSTILSKTYAGFSIVYCSLMSLIALMTIVIPIYDYGLNRSNDEGLFLYHTVIAVLCLVVLTPQPIALMSFYFSGGIGKNWFSHIVFVALLFSFSALILLICHVIYLHTAGIPPLYFENLKLNQLERISFPFSIFAFLHSLFLPMVFAVSALAVRKVNLLTRFLPFISMLSAFLISIILATVIIAIGSVSGIKSIYHGSREATIPHWFMLGSIAWALIGWSAFWKTKEVVSPISPSGQEVHLPVVSTFNTKANNHKSNRNFYLILGGIVAATLLAVFSIVGAAVGMMYLTRPTTTFEGIPNTNRTQINSNSNQQIPPRTKDLKTLIESRKNLFGDFKLYQISTSEQKYYPYPKDKIYSSFYSDRDVKKLTFFDVSVFNNVEDARREAEFRKKYIVEQKLKIKSEKNSDNGVSISFKNKEFFEIFECQDEVCFSVKDKTESVTSMFRLWIFKQIVPEAKKIAGNS